MARYNGSNDYGGHDLSIKERPPMIPAKTTTPQLPTPIDYGVYQGYSLPIGTGSDNEWLKWVNTVPRRWDGVTNPYITVLGILDTAQTDATDAFKLRLDWMNFSPNDVIPATANTLYFEQLTGIAAQYKTFLCTFTIDYDIDPANPLTALDSLGFKLWRVAKSTGGYTEITGEVIIGGCTITYRHDKLGQAWV